MSIFHEIEQNTINYLWDISYSQNANHAVEDWLRVDALARWILTTSKILDANINESREIEVQIQKLNSEIENSWCCCRTFHQKHELLNLKLHISGLSIHQARCYTAAIALSIQYLFDQGGAFRSICKQICPNDYVSPELQQYLLKSINYRFPANLPDPSLQQ